MLDKRTAAVLRTVTAEGEGYRVVDVGELAGGLPAGLRADGQSVDAALRRLAAEGYISVKYSEAGTYCVAPLPKGKEAAKEDARSRARSRLRLGAFWLPFFGAFAGALLAALLFALFF